MQAVVFLFCLLFPLLGHSSSVKLANDSPFQLRATIRSATGNDVGVKVVNANQVVVWTDSPVYSKPTDFGEGNTYQQRPDRSQTPFTVIWRCMDGNDYGINTGIGTGMTASAQGSDGAKICKLEKSPQEKEKELKEQKALCPACPPCPSPCPSTGAQKP